MVHSQRFLFIAVVAAAILGGGALGSSNAPAKAGPISMNPTARISPAGRVTSMGWLGNAGFNFTTGTTSIFIHEDCPASHPVAVTGAFAFNSTGQTAAVYLGYNGPRLDESPPDYHEWGWHFFFPSGSPAGTSATFSIFCAKT